ncbi:hypothetical protein [Mycolicibacterium aubagnense]|uniref:Uncharacterized protein n=1 Tax=Mycolicibacterium aubagnense TaxID=319707 RepID=A0ABM7IK53_9MYCO|nr:hypothetical protein [Mycolicibacterium aubagnense]WGI31403.1 hypothetical protein QDT91_19460 [Mycolicibacterium aubagnense]BBX87160.1 hypothetical protein MAUB_50330 [Mycolicibacterium aubagnense]
MSTAHKVERVVAQITAAVTRRSSDDQAYRAEMERLVTQQELALLSK